MSRNILLRVTTLRERTISSRTIYSAFSVVQPSTKVEVDKLENYFNEDEMDEFHTDVDCSSPADSDINYMLGCYLNLLEIEVIEENPLNCAHISELQQADNKLLALQ